VTRQAPNVASTLARLRNLADAGGLSFNDVLQRYVIERFLARISRLPDADTVLLKGALMLRVWGLPRARPTMDIDMLRRGAADQAPSVSSLPVVPQSRAPAMSSNSTHRLSWRRPSRRRRNMWGRGSA